MTVSRVFLGLHEGSESISSGSKQFDLHVEVSDSVYCKNLADGNVRNLKTLLRELQLYFLSSIMLSSRITFRSSVISSRDTATATSKCLRDTIPPTFV